MSETFAKSLVLMFQGMVGIFAVLLILFFVILVLGKKKQKKEEH
ncbi:MAG: hypothetical protein AB7C91_11490 [Sphaerochaeta sp.]|jgi:Na+-transporting methylmalonyl-CoA/oxaloacetate decarboxylase gamma subunit